MDLRPTVSALIARLSRRGLGVRLCAGAIVVLALTLLIVSLALADPPTFTDVAATHPYHDAIGDLASRGVINGYPDGSFRPDNPVIRQQFAKMIVLSLGLTVSDADICLFPDVPKSLPGSYVDPSDTNYPDHYVAVLLAHGITQGKTATTFAPFDSITCQQLITMVARAAALPDPPADYVPSFSPGQFYPEEHYQNARRAAYAGLLGGLQGIGPTYNFLAPASRGECAQLLYNLIVYLTPTPSSTTTTVPPLGYESLGGALLSGPGVASHGVGNLRVFVRGPSDALWFKTYSGGTWSGWDNAGGVLASDPAAVWQSGDACRVFWLGPDSALWSTTNSGSGWLGPWSWGGWAPGSSGVAFTSSPAVASCAPGHLDVFVRGADNSLWTMTYDWGPNWWFETFWQSLGGVLTSGPAAVSWGPNRIDVFARGPFDHLFHNSFNGTGWSGWNDLGGVLLSGPAVASRGVGLLDVFVRGPGDILWHRSYNDNGGGWSDWQPLPGTMTFNSDPDAVSWGPNRIDVFVRGTDNALWHKWWDGSAWHP